jgi:hypothetical protein
LRRVHIGPERIPLELERAQKGILVLLPRSDFEARVQQAALAAESAANPPRLSRAFYTAHLEGESLVGDADWSVVHNAAGPGLLPLTDCNLALTKRPKIDGADALMGDLDGKSPALWIPESGRPTVRFAWSRRGVLGDGGLHFDLEVPACASAQLKLTLPVGHLVTAKAGVIVESPRADKGDERVWILRFSSRSRVEFVIRQLDQGPALLLATVQSRQELSPDRVLADFDFQVETLRGVVRELVFDSDGPLQVFDVLLGGAEVKKWEWQPAGKDQPSGGQLTVPLREPLHGVLPPLHIRCVALVAKDKKDRTWVSPGLRLRGALARGETLKLHALPEAQLAGWNAGQFRLVKSILEPDGTQVLTLVHGGANVPRPPAPTGAGSGDAAPKPDMLALAPKRPSAILRPRITEFVAQQQSWWQIDQNGASLNCELVCKPSHGQLYHLPLKLPADSQVDQLTVEPREMLRSWAAGSGKTPLLLIDLAQPATAQTPLRIKLQLRLPALAAAAGGLVALPFPDVEPQLPCLREGTLAISIHPRWRGTVVKSTWPAGSTTDTTGPWRETLPDYHFVFHGKPLTGQLDLRPRAPQFQARCQSDAYLGGTRGTLVTRLTLEPTSGSLDHVDLVVSTALAAPWKVRGDAGVRLAGVQRLPALAATAGLLGVGVPLPWEPLAVLATEPGLERWRLRFAEPIRGRVTLVLEAPFDPRNAGAGGERPWNVPIVRVAGAQTFDGEITVQLLGAEMTGVDSVHLQEMPRPAGPKGKAGGAGPSTAARSAWRVFRYGGPGAAGPLPTLRVKTRTVAVELPGRESCDAAALTTYLDPSGRLVHYFHFRVLNWRQRDVRVVLPHAAEVLAARTEGRWLPAMPEQALGNGLEVALPVSAALAVQYFEVWYVTVEDLSTWAAWETVSVAAPVLPVQPLDFRRDWLLPPGVVPLGGAWKRVAHLKDTPAWTQLAEGAWNLGQPLLTSFLPEPALPPWAVIQKQHLAAAERGLRSRFGNESGWILGKILDALALESVPIVVDATALAAAGLTPETAFGSGKGPVSPNDPWTRLNLAVLATPAGLLVTTWPQVVAWSGSHAPATVAAEGPLADAIAEAAQRGHNGTGRFRAAAAWVESRPVLADAAPADGLLLPHGFSPDWTRWETNADVGPQPTLVVVRPRAFHWFGIALAGLLAAGWGLAARRLRTAVSVRWLFGWAGSAALAALWLPTAVRPVALWPTAVAATVAVAWHLAGAVVRRTSVASAPTKVQASVAALVLLAIGAATLGVPSAWSQVPDPNTVLVLPGPAGALDREDVLATPDLLKKLDGLIQRGPAALRGAVLVAAEYHGTLEGEAAQFTADFRFYTFNDKATLKVPLSGVELREGAVLDKKTPVKPTSSPTGYEVAVQDKGWHELKLVFGVRLQGAADHRDLRFAGPRLHLSTLDMKLPATLPETLVLSGAGLAQAGPVDADTQRLTVDLGREGTVHLRWPQTNPAAPAPKVSVREAYFWDLRGPATECTAVLRYTVKGGAISRFTVTLPDTLEPRTVEVDGDPADGDDARPRLKGWQLEPGKGPARLSVQLQAPVTTAVVTLRLIPRYPLGPTLRLALPASIGAQSAGGLVAYRIEGQDAVDKAANMLTVLTPPDQFVKQWQATAAVGTGTPDPAPTPTRAYTFRNRLAEAALFLTMTPPRPAVEQELQWSLHPDRAELTAVLKATSANHDLALVEWEVPAAVTVAEIGGENVRAWTRNATRIQVWLKQPARAVTAKLRGWMLIAKATPGQPQRWSLPWLRCPDAAVSRTVVRLAEGQGVRAELDAKTLTNLVAAPSAASVWVSSAPALFYRAEFVLTPVAQPARVSAVTVAEVREGTLQVSGHWQVHLPHAGKAQFQVHLADWQGPPLTLEGEGVEKIEAPKGEQRWRVVVPVGAPRRLQIRLTGGGAWVPGGLVSMPQFHLDGAVFVEQWLAAQAPGLEPQTAQGLTAVKDLAKVPLPPGVAERVGTRAQVWKATAADWRLTLRILAPAASPGVRILLAEHEVAFGEAFGWIHQDVFWVLVTEGHELLIDMPFGTLLPTVTVDGEPVNPRYLAPEIDRLAVTLSPGEGVRLVRIRWAQAPFAKTVGPPPLITARVVGVPALPGSWTVTVPPGWRLGDAAAGLADHPALATARRELARADAMATATRLLIEQFQKSDDETLRVRIVTNQRQFLRHCRLANNALEGSSTPDDGDLRDQLTQLQRQNAAALASAGLEKLRTQAEKSGPAAADAGGDDLLPAGRGTVLRWQAAADGTGPTLALESTRARTTRQAWAGTCWIVIVMLALLGLTWVPRAADWARRLWPEQLALLVLIGCLAWGISPLASLLLLVAGVGRLWILASVLRSRLQTAPVVPPSGVARS